MSAEEQAYKHVLGDTLEGYTPEYAGFLRDNVMVSARVADYLAGYSRGKAEEQKRIWEAVKGCDVYVYRSELEQIIFGENKIITYQGVPFEMSTTPIEQVGEKHWKIKDPCPYPGFETFETKHCPALERYDCKKGGVQEINLLENVDPEVIKKEDDLMTAFEKAIKDGHE